MVFTDIRLQNFRSYGDSSFEIDPGVNIVVGPNTSGKTNLLEAFMVSSKGKSYRAKDSSLIKNGCEWARVDIHDSKNRQRTVKIVENDERTEKTFEVDGQQFKRLTAKHSHPVVLFEPNHLFLFHDEPQKRREFLDGLAAQTNPEYQSALNRYKRTLMQRNSLLKQTNAKQQVFVWNVKLADLASKIISARIELTRKLDHQLPSVYTSLAAQETEVKINYKSEIPVAGYGTNLLKKLEQNIDRDIEQGFTGSGPHRDDLWVSFGSENIAGVASRGEIRTLLLALKVIETKMIEESLGERPLMLLDDVFSELDGVRRKSLTVFLKKYQTVITTTDADVVVKNFSQNCQILPLSP